VTDQDHVLELLGLEHAEDVPGPAP
jgi:hypothetical protein